LIRIKGESMWKPEEEEWLDEEDWTDEGEGEEDWTDEGEGEEEEL